MKTFDFLVSLSRVSVSTDATWLSKQTKKVCRKKNFSNFGPENYSPVNVLSPSPDSEAFLDLISAKFLKPCRVKPVIAVSITELVGKNLLGIDF